MGAGPSNPLPLILVYCALGFAAALLALERHAWNLSPAARRRVAAEVGLPAGALWWLIIRYVGLGAGSTFVPGLVATLAARAVPWAIAVGLYSAWRIERAGVKGYATPEVTMYICGVALLLFLVISAADVLITNI